MNSSHDKWQFQLAALPLPEVARTKDKVEFDPRSDRWSFRTGGKSVNCNFTNLPPVTPAFLHGFKQVMVGVAETKSGCTITNRFQDVQAILRYTAKQQSGPIDTLTFEELARFSRSSQAYSARLASSRSFLKSWAKLRCHGLPPSLEYEFPSCKRNAYGVAVATQDPRKGPHDDQEFEAVLEAVNYALEKGVIELDRALEVRLTALLGVRPTQVAVTKCCDIKKDEFGRVVFDIPLAKGEDQAARDEFRRFPIEPTTGQVLWDYCQEVRTAFAGILPAPDDAPLFPDVGVVGVTYAPGLAYHTSSSNMSNRLSKTLKSAFEVFRANSVRLGGESIVANALRFRRSFAQRGADEGIDMFVLAHLMGHRTIGSVKVYFEITDRIRARFSKKIVMQMAPLARAFGSQLRILKDLSEATRPSPASRIPDLRLDEHGHLKWLASCASCANCSQLRPYACLAGCSSFEPFLDADLESILDRLIADRELGMGTSEKVATIRDRAIYGCAQIILRQRELLAEDAK